MISCEDLFNIFKNNQLDFFTGVPDSTFKDFMGLLNDENGKSLTNIIQASECEAIATATGYHLATQKIPLVYMQNSGLGKCVNPLTSLCDKDVYGIPMVLMIGWRGKPGKPDEPQHSKMGRITLPLLDTLEVPYKILPPDKSGIEKAIFDITQESHRTSAPVAIILSADILEKYFEKNKTKNNFDVTREEAINLIANCLDRKDIIVSTTGKCSRELYEYRTLRNEQAYDFYTVGSMGCASSIAHAVALAKKDRRVFVFDGDGAALMQLGALSTIGHYPADNFYHIIFDNQAYDSTGEQPTVSDTVDFEKIALACGYKSAKTTRTKQELQIALNQLKIVQGPHMLIVKVKKGARKELGRPKSKPIENKEAFIRHLNF